MVALEELDEIATDSNIDLGSEPCKRTESKDAEPPKLTRLNATVTEASVPNISDALEIEEDEDQSHTNPLTSTVARAFNNLQSEVGQRLGLFESPVQVGAGFLQAYATVRHHMWKVLMHEVRRDDSNVQVIFTGHSLGGALATLAAFDVQLLFPQLSVSMISFGSPRVGNYRFAHLFNLLARKNEMYHLRVVHGNDVITTTPCCNMTDCGTCCMIDSAQWMFWHTGEELNVLKKLGQGDQPFEHIRNTHLLERMIIMGNRTSAYDHYLHNYQEMIEHFYNTDFEERKRRVGDTTDTDPPMYWEWAPPRPRITIVIPDESTKAAVKRVLGSLEEIDLKEKSIDEFVKNVANDVPLDTLDVVILDNDDDAVDISETSCGLSGGLHTLWQARSAGFKGSAIILSDDINKDKFEERMREIGYEGKIVVIESQRELTGNCMACGGRERQEISEILHPGQLQDFLPERDFVLMERMAAKAEYARALKVLEKPDPDSSDSHLSRKDSTLSESTLDKAW